MQQINILSNRNRLKVVLNLPSKLTDEYEQYQLATLIRLDEKDNLEPDCNATYKMASHFLFVR